MEKKRFAIFHNFMDNIGGAEQVTLTLARQLDADIFTTNIDHQKISKMGGQNLRIHSIGRVPINAPFRQQLALWRFSRLNLGKSFDAYIIAGDWAVSAAINNKPNLWYVHSPIREIWDLYDYTRANIVAPFKRPVFDAWVKLNRHLNIRYVKDVNHFVCNSENTQARVKKFLGKDSIVIHPPTETKDFYFQKNKGYWLSVNRLITHKRMEIQMDAFRKLENERLVVVGCYEDSDHFQSYSKKIKEMAPKNVEFRSWVDRDELLSLYSGCKGVISTAVDEDFGLTAVEAMACGKPMIAPRKGGYRETIADQSTGFLLDDVNPDALATAIQNANVRLDSFREPAEKRAALFDTDQFIQGIRAAFDSQ